MTQILNDTFSHRLPATYHGLQVVISYLQSYLLPLVTIAYLLVRLGNETGDAAVSLQKLLKLLFTDDEPLRLPQGFLTCILPIDQQTLEYLNTGSRHRGRWASGQAHTRTYTHAPPLHLTFQRTGSSWAMFSAMSSSTLKVLMTELILNATLYCWHQWRIL